MKERDGTRPGLTLGLLAAAALVLACAVVMLPQTAWATHVCATAVVGSTTDSDGDGFPDWVECGTRTFAGTAGGTFPSCLSGISPCLNPDTKNLFVILVRAAASLIPPDSEAIEFISKPTSQGGLGVTVHVITSTQAASTRQVFTESPQKAVRVTESLDTNGDTLGACTQGTPNGLDACTIFTQRITNFITSVYASAGLAVPAGEIAKSIKHTIAHEVGHSLNVAAICDSRFGPGCHYKSGTLVLMEQSPTCTVKGSTVNCPISVNYTDPDKAGAALK